MDLQSNQEPVLESGGTSNNDETSSPDAKDPLSTPRWVLFEDGSERESGTTTTKSSSVTAIEPATIEPSSSTQMATHSPAAESLTTNAATASSSLGSKSNGSVGVNSQLALSSPMTANTQAMSNDNETPIMSISASALPSAFHRVPNDKPFANGDILCTVRPQNTGCAWITRATFRPELVPEELMAQSLDITVEEYVSAIEMLTHDLRFNLYITLYKRILALWIAIGFIILLVILFSASKGIILFGGGVLWLIINASGIFACMWLKYKINRMLEQCIAHVNQTFIGHKILMGVDDLGHISCHKVNLIFVFFDLKNCMNYLRALIARAEEAEAMQQPRVFPGTTSVHSLRSEIGASEITIDGSNVKIPQKDKTAEKLILRYSQRWIKEYSRKRIDLNIRTIHGDASIESGSGPVPPRHCPKARCLCQYIEEHLRFKPLTSCSWKELFV